MQIQTILLTSTQTHSESYTLTCTHEQSRSLLNTHLFHTLFPPHSRVTFTHTNECWLIHFKESERPILHQWVSHYFRAFIHCFSQSRWLWCPPQHKGPVGLSCIGMRQWAEQGLKGRKDTAQEKRQVGGLDRAIDQEVRRRLSRADWIRLALCHYLQVGEGRAFLLLLSPLYNWWHVLLSKNTITHTRNMSPHEVKMDKISDAVWISIFRILQP